MEEIVNRILAAMSTVKKPQRVFIAGLFSVLMIFHGRATFRNMSRYCDMGERRFSRWYRRDFDFATFNHLLLTEMLPEENEYIAAIDANFIEKSGKKTAGIGKFYNGKTGYAERGLEMSLVSIIDLQANTAYSFDARQTLDDPEKKKTRTAGYVQQVQELVSRLKAHEINYLVMDNWYSKAPFIDPVLDSGLQVVGKLRTDAALFWLYKGDYRGVGRPKKYDGKVNFNKDKDRFDHVGQSEQGEDIYTAVVWSRMLNRNIRLVMLSREEKYALLFSSDTALDAKKLISYYKARFQIEFLFRDARGHTGLTHCQSLKQEAIHTYINASMTTLNLLKLQDRKVKKTDKETVISIASWKRRKCNQNIVKLLFQHFGFSRKDKKVQQAYVLFSNYGTIAA